MACKKINILQLISSLEVGGAEKLLIDLLYASNPDEINFTIVVMNDKVNESLKKELLNTKCNIYFLNRPQGHKQPKYFFQLINIIKKNKIEIIHSHNDGSKIWSILLKLFMPRIKTVYTVHDTNIINKMAKKEYFLHKHFIDMNIAISKAVMAECRKYNINNVTHIYNGIYIKNFYTEANKKNSIFKIINIARITYNKKGQDILIKALKICKDKNINFKCDFVGGVYSYDKESYTYLKTLVKDLNLEKEINFLGTQDDIPKLLSQSDLFVLPSRYEGLGLVVLEAIASKVPVIASNIDGPAELIKHEENGLLFESGNYQDLADKILYLYDNKEKMECLTQRAYQLVKEFDISFMYKKYFELYESLI